MRLLSVDCSVWNTNTPAQLTRLAVCAISSLRSAASAEAFDSRFFSCTDDSKVRSVYRKPGLHHRDELTLLLVGLQDLPLRINQLSFQLGQLQSRSLFGQLDLEVELPMTLQFNSCPPQDLDSLHQAHLGLHLSLLIVHDPHLLPEHPFPKSLALLDFRLSRGQGFFRLFEF